MEIASTVREREGFRWVELTQRTTRTRFFLCPFAMRFFHLCDRVGQPVDVVAGAGAAVDCLTILESDCHGYHGFEARPHFVEADKMESQSQRC